MNAGSAWSDRQQTVAGALVIQASAWSIPDLEKTDVRKRDDEVCDVVEAARFLFRDRLRCAR